MAITKISRSKRGSSGSIAYAEFPGFTLEYDLHSTTPDDQQATVLTYFEANVISRGQPYTAGLYGALDPAQAAICDRISATWDELSCDPYIWRVSAHFSGLAFGTGTPPAQGTPPVEWETAFATGSQTLREEPILAAYMMGGLEGSTSISPTPAIGDFMSVVNGTGRALIDPPLTMEVVGEFLRISMVVPDHNQLTQRNFIGYVNDRNIAINFENFVGSYLKDSLLLREVDVTMIKAERDIQTGQQGSNRYRVTWSFEWDPGLHERTVYNIGWDWLTPFGDLQPILNRQGVEFSSPQPIDKNGLPKATEIDPPSGRYGAAQFSDWETHRWRVETEANFLTIPYCGYAFIDTS